MLDEVIDSVLSGEVLDSGIPALRQELSETADLVIERWGELEASALNIEGLLPSERHLILAMLAAVRTYRELQALENA